MVNHADIKCRDCNKAIGFDGQGPAYAYGDHWKCQDHHAKMIRAEKKGTRKLSTQGISKGWSLR